MLVKTACAAVWSPADQDRFICIYPVFGLNAFLEKNKMYSREWNRDVQHKGRVWAQLRREDGSLCLVHFPSHEVSNAVCSINNTTTKNKDTKKQEKQEALTKVFNKEREVKKGKERKRRNKPGTVAHTCNASTLGGQGRGIMRSRD
uniref:Signal recognition particle 19 kDa protein n=1 Tax=Piliocolobus tephrosceles TaxID=591936 RepID=A0A8C9HCU7_9PRIM